MIIPYIQSAMIPYLLFFDLETVAEVSKEDYHTLSDRKKSLWEHKVSGLIARDESLKNFTIEEIWEQKACLFAEFGKIASASFGIFNENQQKFYLKNIYSENENEILDAIIKFFENFNEKGFLFQLCGFNIEGFDIPFLTKRFIIKKRGVPVELNSYGKKPWELTFVDILKVWMGTGFQDRYMIKLDLLAESLGIPSSKDEMEGKDVYKYYYVLKDLKSIAKYCGKDVIGVANCAMVLAGRNLITDVQEI